MIGFIANGGWHSRTFLLMAMVGAIIPGSAFSQNHRSQQNLEETWRQRSATPFQPQLQRSASEASHGWRVSLVAWKACPEALSDECYFFKVEDETTDQTSEFRLANQTAQVDAIGVVSRSRAAILGRASPNLAIVTVVELPSGKEIDRFLGFGPALSPDGRLVAYRKFEPAHPGYQYTASTEYLVYDLTASPQDNRTPANRDRPFEPYDAGWPLYPGGLMNAPGDNILEGHDLPAHWMTSDGFFWLDQKDIVAFVDRWRGVDSLVLADLSQGVRQPRVTVPALDTGNIVDLASCRDKVAASDFDNWSKDPASLISVTDIAPSPEDASQIRLTLAPHPCVTSTTLDVPVSQR